MAIRHRVVEELGSTSLLPHDTLRKARASRTQKRELTGGWEIGQLPKGKENRI